MNTSAVHAKVSQIVKLFEHAQLVALLLDETGVVQLMNAFGRNLFGNQSASLIGERFSDALVDEPSCVHVEYRLGQLLAGTQPHFNHESILKNSDGKRLFIDWHHARLEQDDGSCSVLTIGYDLSSQKKAEKNLAWLAHHDSLTKIYNRHRFEDDFGKILHHAQRYGHGGALLCIDIDHFKLINDSFGYKAGDELLCRMATHLSQHLRATDLPARIGGDEFGVVVDEIDEDDAMGIAHKLVQSLSSLRMKFPGGRHQISVSLGMVLYPRHGKTVEELLAKADVALHAAKRKVQTYGRLFVYDEDDTQRKLMREHVDRKALVEQALEKDRFTLVYQPVVSAINGWVHHHEALLRIIDEQDGLLPPSEFIDVAERCGLIYHIDCQVVKLACRELSRWLADGKTTHIAVNLSAQTLDAPDFADFVIEQLREHAIGPNQLTFEITERSAVANMEAAQRIIGMLKGHGCSFSLDDFGMGFSSWLYLKKLPVDHLKLDGSFITHLPEHQDDQIFVKAMNEVAQGLGIQTIAECVEDKETLDLLAGIGVNLVQGYYLGRPTPRIKLRCAQIAEPNTSTTKKGLQGGGRSLLTQYYASS